MTRFVFVYGTLKRGLHNAHYLAGQRFAGEARTEPVYRMVDCGGYPGMFPVAEGGRSIVGEVWEVTESCLKKLDLLEDIARGEYERVAVRLLPPRGGVPSDVAVEGYVYLRETSFLRDAGENWRDTPKTKVGLAEREMEE